MKRLKQWLKKPLDYLAFRVASGDLEERLLLAQGNQLARRAHGLKNLSNIDDAEFRIFSQFGDDGIIQYLTSHIAFRSKTFIEFGVENYAESNTRFLLMNNNWSGLVLDGSEDNITGLKQCDYYWRYDLVAESAFITAENINDLLSHRTFAEVGLLHIDIDGNDYWIWHSINSIQPAVVIVEYNSVFGKERAITIPYSPGFQRTKAHYSNLYFGASLPALTSLGARKGYAFVGSNSAGNNAYFVRVDLLNEDIKEVSIEQGYRMSKFRESRNQEGDLTYLAGEDRLRQISGLPVVNVETDEIENL
jgi:hypothetical protein